MVLISPLTEGRGKAFGQLVERTLHKIHEGGGIKVRAMLPNGSQARASMLDSVTETADAALTPATWAMDSRDAGGRGAGGSRVPHNVAANDRSPRMGRSHRKEREVTLTAVCESRAERFSERSSAAAGGAAPALPSRSPRVDPWNVGGVACGGSGVGSMQQQHQKQQDHHHHHQQQQRQRTGLDAQLPEWGPELHEVQPQLPLGHPYPPRFDAAPAAAQGHSPRHPHRRGAAAGGRRRTNAVEEPAPWPTTTPAWPNGVAIVALPHIVGVSRGEIVNSLRSRELSPLKSYASTFCARTVAWLFLLHPGCAMPIGSTPSKRVIKVFYFLVVRMCARKPDPLALHLYGSGTRRRYPTLVGVGRSVSTQHFSASSTLPSFPPQSRETVSDQTIGTHAVMIHAGLRGRMRGRMRGRSNSPRACTAQYDDLCALCMPSRLGLGDRYSMAAAGNGASAFGPRECLTECSRTWPNHWRLLEPIWLC